MTLATLSLLSMYLVCTNEFKLLKAKLQRKVVDRLDLEKLGQKPNATASDR